MAKIEVALSRQWCVYRLSQQQQVFWVDKGLLCTEYMYVSSGDM